MIKLIKRLIFLAMLFSAGFMYVSVKHGGKAFRQAGDTVKQGAYEMAETSDVIRESTLSIRKSVRETVDSLTKTGSRIKETGTRLARKVDETGDAARESFQELKNRSGDTFFSARTTDAVTHVTIQPQ